MNKLIIATLISLTPYNTVIADTKSVVEKPVTETKLDPGCITKKQADEVLDKGGYEILVRGQDPLKRAVELWFNGKKEMVVIAYTPGADNNPDNIKEVCIQSFGENIVFNGDSVELLNKALDHVNPKI